MNLTDEQVREIQDQMAKSNGISPDAYQQLLEEAGANVCRSRLAALGVII